MCRCPIVVFLDLSGCFLMNFSARLGQVFSKPCLIVLRLLAVVGMKSAACKYWASSGLGVCARMLFTTVSYCCVTRSTSHIPVFLFLVPLIIYFPFFWTDISCLSSVTVHPSSHRTPDDINGAVWIFGKMWICLACLLIPGIWSVAICAEYIMLTSGSHAVMSFEIITGAIVGVDCFYRCIFAPESAIASMLLLRLIGGVSI